MDDSVNTRERMCYFNDDCIKKLSITMRLGCFDSMFRKHLYKRGDGRLGRISVRFTMLRGGKRCYRNDRNIMTPRYGEIVFIRDLQLYTVKRASIISPTIVVCVVYTDDD